MSGPLRNKQGCWTCRLRKKKCDERHPQCSNCEYLSITCYGFGPKPEWMDNGEKEREIINSLKEIVRHTSRRKTLTRPSEQRETPIRIKPKAVSVAVKVDLTSDSALHQEHGKNSGHATDVTGNLDHSDNTKHGSLLSLSTDISVLLVHFIDHVLPLQYPYYQPEAAAGGKGWLLTLLSESKPLYHAVLASAACHRRTLALSEADRVVLSVQQEEHLKDCLESINVAAQGGCPKSGLGVWAGITQAMFFELFNNHGHAWQAHLRAAINIFLRSERKNFASFGLSKQTRWILSADLGLPEDDPVIAREVVCFRFLSSTLVWLDIASSITMGITPLLLSHHPRILSTGSQVQLRNIMGCENWVLLQIARISELHKTKSSAPKSGQSDPAQLELITSDISLMIQSGLSHMSVRSSSLNLSLPTYPHAVVTQMYAYMAVIYLHLVTNAFERLDLLDSTINSAMKVLQTQLSIQELSTLIGPLSFVGIVSKPSDRHFFLDTLSTPPVLNPFLNHRRHILPILEKVWATRGVPGFTWTECVELLKDILLV
ncbi:fungal-specific transcription factor domain-containing protein [Pyrenochaeta sp. MPI-SDFR-AT-0127]|nr:fungal-specific transcription factor domain-containing protein [Pyrenochaeta sp. MPI-SDFR-AT-0127]